MSVALPTSSASEFAEQQYWDTFFVEVRSASRLVDAPSPRHHERMQSTDTRTHTRSVVPSPLSGIVTGDSCGPCSGRQWLQALRPLTAAASSSWAAATAS